MAAPSQLHAYSLLTDDVLDIGPVTADYDAILELGDMMATARPDIIVFVEPPVLQKWEPSR